MASEHPARRRWTRGVCGAWPIPRHGLDSGDRCAKPLGASAGVEGRTGWFQAGLRPTIGGSTEHGGSTGLGAGTQVVWKVREVVGHVSMMEGLMLIQIVIFTMCQVGPQWRAQFQI